MAFNRFWRNRDIKLVILDTSAIFTCFEFSIDIDDEIINLIGKCRISIPKPIYNEIELKQTCVINGTFCDSCNISSVDYPNGSRIISDIAMTKRISDFNYTLNENLVNVIGRYRVNGYCDYGSDVRRTWVYYLDVTPSGFTKTYWFYIIIIIFF